MAGVSLLLLLLLLLLTYTHTRYIVIPEDKGSDLICISALGPTAGERVNITHPVPNCPSSMAVDSRRWRHVTAHWLASICNCCSCITHPPSPPRSGGFVFAFRQKIFVSGDCHAAACCFNRTSRFF